jgi:hypothetical protein
MTPCRFFGVGASYEEPSSYVSPLDAALKADPAYQARARDLAAAEKAVEQAVKTKNAYSEARSRAQAAWYAKVAEIEALHAQKKYAEMDAAVAATDVARDAYYAADKALNPYSEALGPLFDSLSRAQSAYDDTFRFVRDRVEASSKAPLAPAQTASARVFSEAPAPAQAPRRPPWLLIGLGAAALGAFLLLRKK